MADASDQADTTTEANRVRAALAAHPMLDSVGDLAQLLAKLPPDMALVLDEHVRVDPDEPGQTYTVTPRLTGMVDYSAGTPQQTLGLELGQVCVPAYEDDAAQAAAVVRRGLVPENTLVRGERRVEGGDLRDGLTDVTAVLESVARLLTDAAAWLGTGDPDADSLRVEAGRIDHAAARVAQLAKTVEVPE
ncbi:hypothetical protein ACFU9B_42305 [Streptomyces sp. NPDC057592]|uniref:hypothetical protein n=1 Tax=unclassified Streptomyces TaxID=2593676 RepID=UPI0036B35EFB